MLGNFTELTINDYTLIANKEKIVSMDTAVSVIDKQEALVNVNQIAYNTAYSIDFLKGGEELEPEKIYRAKAISVTPGSFEVDDDTCAFASAENFIKDGSNGQTGLSFRLTTNCNPTQVVTQTPGVNYPTAVTFAAPEENEQEFYEEFLGEAQSYGVGSNLYFDSPVETDGDANMQVRVRVRVNEVSLTPDGDDDDTDDGIGLSYTDRESVGNTALVVDSIGRCYARGADNIRIPIKYLV